MALTNDGENVEGMRQHDHGQKLGHSTLASVPWLNSSPGLEEYLGILPPKITNIAQIYVQGRELKYSLIIFFTRCITMDKFLLITCTSTWDPIRIGIPFLIQLCIPVPPD
jgi:hypothetical protein